MQEYYDKLKSEDPVAFKRQFSQWTKVLGGKSFEDIYAAAHKAIRAKPEREARKAGKVTRTVVQAAPQLI